MLYLDKREKDGGGILKKRIHINQHKIRANAKDGGNRPVITVKTYKSNDYGYRVEILGSSTVVYSPDKPLACGAKVWIETEGAVILEPLPRPKKKLDTILKIMV